MFLLKLYDRKGKELHEGDIVAVSDGRRFSFYCEVKYLAKEKVIAPFHTFSFHSFEKVDKVCPRMLYKVPRSDIKYGTSTTKMQRKMKQQIKQKII